MPSKKKLKKQLNAARGKLLTLSIELETSRKFATKTAQERSYWRNQFERQVLTPEAKVDTEAAFKRGEEFATQKFRAWFLKTAQELNTVTQDSNEE